MDVSEGHVIIDPGTQREVLVIDSRRPPFQTEIMLCLIVAGVLYLARGSVTFEQLFGGFGFRVWSCALITGSCLSLLGHELQRHKVRLSTALVTEMVGLSIVSFACFVLAGFLLSLGLDRAVVSLALVFAIGVGCFRQAKRMKRKIDGVLRAASMVQRGL